MAEYVYIQNYNKQGIMGISHNVFDQITEIATNEVSGANVAKSKARYSLFKPVKCKITNGTVQVRIILVVEPQVNVDEVVKAVKENVATALSEITELIPFDINVVIKDIGK